MPTRTINKSAFVRSLPATMSASDVVKAAKAKGIEISDKYVHTIRYNAKSGSTGSATSTRGKRGPGRPRKTLGRSVSKGPAAGSGLVSELESLIARVVEQKVAEVLKAKLAGLV
jgi:hypothetical protein